MGSTPTTGTEPYPGGEVPHFYPPSARTVRSRWTRTSGRLRPFSIALAVLAVEPFYFERSVVADESESIGSDVDAALGD